jgi:hypothetical protein
VKLYPALKDSGMSARIYESKTFFFKIFVFAIFVALSLIEIKAIFTQMFENEVFEKISENAEEKTQQWYQKRTLDERKFLGTFIGCLSDSTLSSSDCIQKSSSAVADKSAAKSAADEFLAHRALEIDFQSFPKKPWIVDVQDLLSNDLFASRVNFVLRDTIFRSGTNASTSVDQLSDMLLKKYLPSIEGI